jgi:hypothetical protein
MFGMRPNKDKRLIAFEPLAPETCKNQADVI